MPSLIPLQWRLKRHSLLHSKQPILVGPWHSEVGFEALYWLPFLEQLVADGVDRSRLIPISRCGASAWYGTATGLELYGMRTPQQVRVENRVQHKQTGMLKQIRVTDFDRQIYKDAAATLGLTAYQTLHPRWMYQTLAPFWEAHYGLQWLATRTRWRVLEPPPLPGNLELPAEFIAVRFYLRPTFGGEMVRQLTVATIEKMAKDYPVIVLHSDVHADDHTDLLVSGLPNVRLLRDLVPLNPETNLLVQSAVLARCSAFVGTYGGFAQLALRFGRSVVSFFDQWHGTAVAHKHLADAMALQMGIPFQVLAVSELPMLQMALPKIVRKRPDVETQPQPTAVA